jgi:hypothetical protein
MDYLQRLFNRELDEEGEVKILNSIFDRSNILWTMDNQTYSAAFNAWKLERENNLIERGKEILNLLDDNLDWFNKLRDLFKRGKVIPFIGAGMSIASGFPGWRAFLESVRQEVLDGDEIEKFTSLLDEGKYEDAAQYLADREVDYLQEKLNNKFGKELPFDKIEGVICRLPDFFNGHIATTNYDLLIDTVLREKDISFHVANGLHTRGLMRTLTDNERVLLKLHGIYNTEENRIITTADYQWHYESRDIVPQCIRDLCSNTLLFIGCSLSVDRTIEVMRAIKEERGRDNAVRHYAFLSNENLSEEERRERRRELQKANIFPIWYDGDHDEDIEALLELLVDSRRTS